ncbi:uncharacterized transmembrane protein DDB_G0289901-like [Poecile atricapillus]|uniref:uncharacterized transmembrane protein DDB_G0289901-like n=1 Tax=Poecile atricapillus TaxID=48891 RepID=UPI0027383FAE|nr:uncharacterized transmembrane protein DDB_G0289901-like [Poecile atricapillus]
MENWEGSSRGWEFQGELGIRDCPWKTGKEPQEGGNSRGNRDQGLSMENWERASGGWEFQGKSGSGIVHKSNGGWEFQGEFRIRDYPWKTGKDFQEGGNSSENLGSGIIHKNKGGWEFQGKSGSGIVHKNNRGWEFQGEFGIRDCPWKTGREPQEGGNSSENLGSGIIHGKLGRIFRRMGIPVRTRDQGLSMENWETASGGWEFQGKSGAAPGGTQDQGLSMENWEGSSGGWEFQGEFGIRDCPWKTGREPQEDGNSSENLGSGIIHKNKGGWEFQGKSGSGIVQGKLGKSLRRVGIPGENLEQLQGLFGIRDHPGKMGVSGRVGIPGGTQDQGSSRKIPFPPIPRNL